uniref:Methyltransferase domain-containing protein n=2 Tax=Hemiselmis andersenii TaxID=464988 RepID=A0A7S1EBS1_HEMAN
MAREAMIAHVSRDYLGALRRYLFAFKVQPSLAPHFHEEFMTLLRDSSSLESTSLPPRDLLPLLTLAVSLFPDEPEPLAALATVQYKSGALRSSISTWEKLLKISPLSLLALESRDNLCSSMVDRWHFRMLNDEQRNRGFQEAIGRAVAEGRKTVLDVGCGTGFLSILAAREGAVRVVGCDLNEAMCEMAREAVNVNRVREGVVEVLNVNSKNLTLKEEERVGLVVSETADCGLLGERMLGSLQSAKETLTVSGGRIVPSKARLHVMLLASPFLKSMCVINPAALVGFEIPSSLRLEPLDPYLCEYIRECPYSPLSAQTPSLQFDIPEALDALPHVVGFPVTATQDGSVDAIAMWWDMWLDDDCFITTTPHRECASGGKICSAWEQAVFVPPNQVSPVISKGDAVLIDVACTPKCVHVRLSAEPQGLQQRSVSVGERDVSVLNDKGRNQAYDKAIRKALAQVRGGRGRAVDLSRGWSITCLMAARAGARTFLEDCRLP